MPQLNHEEHEEHEGNGLIISSFYEYWNALVIHPAGEGETKDEFLQSPLSVTSAFSAVNPIAEFRIHPRFIRVHLRLKYRPAVVAAAAVIGTANDRSFRR